MIGFLRTIVCLTLLIWAAGFTNVVTGASPAYAQDTAAASQVDYEAWKQVAERAEGAVSDARASTPAFAALRKDLVEWREKFQGARSINEIPIDAIQQQLDALGPEPEKDKGTEPEDIAAQRKALNARLSELRAPVTAAQVAFNQADGLIRAIDTIIRDRQAEKILEFGPTPLNPVHWWPAVQSLQATVQSIRGEFVVAWSNKTQRLQTTEDLPAVALFLALGMVLIIRGRKWSRRFTNSVLGDNPGAGRWIMGFILSLGSFVIPLVGVFLVVKAIFATGLVGLRTAQLLDAVMPSAVVFLFARWLGMRVFPVKEARTLPLNLDEHQRFLGRWNATALGLLAGTYLLLEKLAEQNNWAEGPAYALLFPLLVGAAATLWKVARLLDVHSKNAADADGDETYRTQLTKLLALGLSILAILAPILAAIGYFRLAHFTMFPTLISLQILAALLVLQRVVVEAYVLITGNREAATESLTPVLIGFLMVLLSLPAFALVWGARVTDLTELWAKAMAGIDVGGLVISPRVFVTFVAVFIMGYVATRLVQGTLKNTILPKTRIEPGGQVAIVSGLGYVGIFLAAIIAITSAGIDLSSIAIVAGALSVGIGFGLQTIVSNFVSGIILLIERPIANGDWIEVGGIHGTVKQISVRATVIETFDRSDVIVPNSDLVSGRVTNYTRGNTVGRVIVSVGVAYGSDTRQVERILQEVAEAHPMVLLSTPPFVVFQGFGADSLDFEIRAILRDVNWVLSVKSDMNHEINRRFVEEGIEVPFAQRDIWIRNPETLVKQPGKHDTPVLPPSEASRAHLTGDDLGDGQHDDGGDGADR